LRALFRFSRQSQIRVKTDVITPSSFDEYVRFGLEIDNSTSLYLYGTVV